MAPRERAPGAPLVVVLSAQGRFLVGEPFFPAGGPRGGSAERIVVERTKDAAPGRLALLQPASRGVRVDGCAVDLTGAEFDVLRVLVEQAGEIVNKEELSKRALNRRLGSFDRSIDMHISRLRQKLGPHGDGSARLRSVRNRGYLYARPG